LRASALLAAAGGRPAPPGAAGPYGPGIAYGSAAFVAHEAADLAPASAPGAARPIAGRFVAGSLWPHERFLLRIPERWNGRLVVAGTPAQRSEFACDRLFAEPLLARGFAYVSGNKGLGDGVALLDAGVRLEVDGAQLPRFALPGGRGVSFWQHAPGMRIERWLEEYLALAEIGSDALRALHGSAPRATYAVGLSNGGYQVRRAIETSDAFAGALTWNAVLWTPEHNVLRHLPQAIAAMEAAMPGAVAAFGFPPDVAAAEGDGSLYRKNLGAYWYVTAWLHAMHLDPETSLAYGDTADPERADAWSAKIGTWRFERDPRIAERVAAFSNTGRIRCKTIELASEYDHLIAPLMHLAPYAALVAGAGAASSYRLRLLAAAQHVDAWADDPAYPQMRPAHARVMVAFDELVRWVEGVTPQPG
jgi:hypothetical protein